MYRQCSDGWTYSYVRVSGVVSVALLSFQRLYQISRLNAGTQLHAKTPLNISRNRYRDVLPSECVCVCVCGGEGRGSEEAIIRGNYRQGCYSNQNRQYNTCTYMQLTVSLFKPC